MYHEALSLSPLLRSLGPSPLDRVSRWCYPPSQQQAAAESRHCHPSNATWRVLARNLVTWQGVGRRHQQLKSRFIQVPSPLRGSKGNEIDREFLWESSRGPLRKGTCPGCPASNSEQQRGCWILGPWFRPFLAADLGHTLYLSPAKQKAPDNPISGMVTERSHAPRASAWCVGSQVLPRPSHHLPACENSSVCHILAEDGWARPSRADRGHQGRCAD